MCSAKRHVRFTRESDINRFTMFDLEHAAMNSIA
jgi:hypothetical protein